ncbi:chorismate mutase [Polymorphum gilvum]|uniref:chorismate mutase n=1 Tax=Polymorphum gilvum (strain LMG 25793 / CGMCC 1.9160 / SL003B-26A1) TaxID=991905 RepID=F2J0B8_POLGS|nr:chorismate mutase [Polymorphum gilvum]ADZ68653.1 Chorismate mutase [Polymorphum gilvum SL003B-26A1]
MSDDPAQLPSLDALRRRIDAIDADLHRLLMDRARVIDGIVAAKRASGAEGVMFRPDREADMMRRMVERHAGSLPLTAVEHLWREIISTSTRLQGDYRVHLDGGADIAAMRDLARFYFGFSVEMETPGDAADVVGTVAASVSDLGIVALSERADLPWWRGLGTDGAQIVARLPFFVAEDRPADLPAVVICRPIPGQEMPDTRVFDARWIGALPGSLMNSGIEVLSFFRTGDGVDALLAVSADMTEEDVLAACIEAGAEPDVLRPVGGYAAPIDIDPGAEDEFETGGWGDPRADEA